MFGRKRNNKTQPKAIRTTLILPDGTKYVANISSKYKLRSLGIYIEKKVREGGNFRYFDKELLFAKNGKYNFFVVDMSGTSKDKSFHHIETEKRKLAKLFPNEEKLKLYVKFKEEKIKDLFEKRKIDFEKEKKVVLPFEDQDLWKRLMSIDPRWVKDFTELSKVLFIITQRDMDLGSLRESLKESKEFFESTFTTIVDRARRLPELFKDGIEYLRKGNTSIRLSKLQVSSILANSFLCTFDRSSSQFYWEFNLLPSINFDEMYTSIQNPTCKVAKLLMILNYFRKISIIKVDEEMIDIRRVSKNRAIDSLDLNIPLGEIEIKLGKIEDSGSSALHIDFANAYVGGACISYGCVQEEIMFSTNPELIVSRLFCPKMKDNEVILFKNCNRYSEYKGYAFSLGYGGDCERKEEELEIVAMDAHYYSGRTSTQYEKVELERELWKCYVGFTSSDKDVVATGNWGCGAFGGDVELKFLLQWIVSSYVKKKLLYYVVNDEKLLEKCSNFAKYLVERKTTASEKSLWLCSVPQCLCGFDGTCKV